MTPTGEFVSVDGAQVHYARKGAGPALILIHGASGNLRDWQFNLMDKLAQRFDVIAFDRPGHGFSDRIANADDPRVQGAHLSKAASALGVEKPLVVGHSFGGTVALGWAITAPTNMAGLCVLSAPSHVWPGRASWLYTFIDNPITGPLIAANYKRFATEARIETGLKSLYAPDPVPTGYRDALALDLAFRPKTVRWNAADVNRLKPRVVEMAPFYRTLTMPVEIIHGDTDTTVPLYLHSRPLHAAISHSRLNVLENAGHMPHHAHSDAMFAAIERLRTYS